MEVSLMVPESTKFADDIKDIMKEKQIECIDAVLLWCEKNNLEIEYAADFIKKNPVLTDMIESEAIGLNFLKKKSARLPL